MARKDDGKKTRVTGGIGAGGLLKGVGELIDLVSEMAEKGVQTQEKVREFQGEGPLKDVRGVFGVSVKMGIGGEGTEREVSFEPFGNISKTETGVAVDEVREPIVDVFDEGAELRVVGELPGVEQEDIRIDVQGDVLQISAERGTRRYVKELVLPEPVADVDIELTHTNGILEIRLPKRTNP